MTDPADDDQDAPPAAADLEIQQFTSLRAAVQDALEDTPHLRRDRAMIALAFRYADLVDDAADRLAQADGDDEARDFGRMAALVAKIGPRLEATLNALGMAPGARPAVRGGDPHSAPVDLASAVFAALRAGAVTPAAGLDPAAVVDPSVTEADAGD